MGKRALAAALVAASLGAAVAAEQAGPTGYLRPDAFDVLAVLPPAPTEGDARAQADRAIFRETRRLVDTPRWAMATNDVKLSPTDLMRDFSCAAGVALTPDNAPRLMALVTRASVDTIRQTNRAKDFYRRKRPYLLDQGATCQPPAELHGSFDYPSGHATLGWTWATLLASAMPDRATAILARGRAYGESRVVCGVHNASAVEAARLSASATLDIVATDAAFGRDLASVRTQLSALRRTAPIASGQCAAERALIAQRIY